MFYFPGSWYIGSAIEWFLNLWITIEFWPFSQFEQLDWDDNERRGAGSLFILLVLLVAGTAGALVMTGVI